MDLLTRIDAWRQIVPDRIAHISEGRTLTYGDLIRRSNALAAYLAWMLPNDGSPIAVLGHKEPEMLIAFLGAVKSGHPYIPLDTSLPAHRIECIIAMADARLTLTPELVATVSDGYIAAPDRQLDASDPFYIIFTSGSTGEPKGVVITLGCLTNFVNWMLSEHTLHPFKETFLNQAPFSFDLSVMDLYLSLVTGGSLWSITKDEIANPKRLFKSLSASNVTTWVSTPSFAQMCLVERGFTRAMLPELRRFLFCGETLAPEVAAQLLERFPTAEVWNTYGPTEATVATTSIRIDRDILARLAPLPVGYPMTGTQIFLIDKAGQPVETDESGEIVICGPNVSPGYLGRTALTEQAFFTYDGMQAYRTGDHGHFQKGMLFFDGRTDNRIKLHGYRVELGDVEANLQALPEIRDAVVIPVMKREQPDSLAAFVILREPRLGTDTEVARVLREELAARVPSYMLPRKFRFLEAFPMTMNGKVDRRRLAETLT